MASTLVSISDSFAPGNVPIEIQCVGCQQFILAGVLPHPDDPPLQFFCCSHTYLVEASGFSAFGSVRVSAWRETTDPAPIGLTLIRE